VIALFEDWPKGRISMASAGKKKTTFTKLAREQRLRERRREKQAKKDARRRMGEEGPVVSQDSSPDAGDV
jgi:hypothetical protein